jgi:hypothetical protein
MMLEGSRKFKGFLPGKIFPLLSVLFLSL